jgi:hypothetical protein
MATFELPEGHDWQEVDCDSGVGVDYCFECAKCGAEFYVNIDQGEVTTEFTPGNEECEQ